MSVDNPETKPQAKKARKPHHSIGLWMGIRTLCWSMWRLHRWATVIAAAAFVIAVSRMVWTGIHGVGMMDTMGFGTPWIGVWLALVGSWTILSGDWGLIRAIARKRALDLMLSEGSEGATPKS